MKKQTVKITFCAIMAALGTVFMLLSYFPYFTYAVPAVSGVLTLVVLIELGDKWPFFTYLVTSVLVFIFAEPESKLMYILLFGYYPFVKAIIERIKSRVVQYLIKFAIFNVAVVAVYAILSLLFGVNIIEMGKYGVWGTVGVVLLANITFYLYDIVLVRVANMYLRLLHPKIKKIFK